MKCLVTGAAGFVGSALCSALLSRGNDVIGIDSFTDYYDQEIKRRNIARLPQGSFELIEADINQVDVSQLLADMEVIFHQAGQPGVRKSWGTDFGRYIDANVGATQRLLEAARKSESLRRFVYASSSSVYGNASHYPTTECDNPQPMSPYGVTKLAAEHLCSLYASNFGVPTVSLRYFTVYGPGQRPDMAFTRFLRAAINHQPLTVFGDGAQIRDFTYIDDIVDANIAAAVGTSEPGRVYNVAGGTNISVRQVLEIIEGLVGKLEVNYTDAVAGDVSRTGGSTDRIQDELNWRPRVELPDGLAKQHKWCSEEFEQESGG